MGIHILQTLSCIPKRLFRLIVPITLVFCFSLGFSYLFILSKAKFRTSQKLSWQRWDVISLNADGSVPAGAGSGIGHGGHGGNGTEWWEKEELDAGDAPAGTSLPLDVWSPLLPHATGCKLLHWCRLNGLLSCFDSDRDCYSTMSATTRFGR